MGTRVLQQFAVLATGLVSGAMLLIGVSWVQVWRLLEPSAFLAVFADAAPRIGGMMVPLDIGAILLSVAAALVSWQRGGVERASFGLSAVLMLVAGAIYPVYYTEANAAFGSGSFPLSEVGPELARWETWHWVRTACGTLAFILAVVGLSKRTA